MFCPWFPSTALQCTGCNSEMSLKILRSKAIKSATLLDSLERGSSRGRSLRPASSSSSLWDTNLSSIVRIRISWQAISCTRAHLCFCALPGKDGLMSRVEVPARARLDVTSSPGTDTTNADSDRWLWQLFCDCASQVVLFLTVEVISINIYSREEARCIHSIILLQDQIILWILWVHNAVLLWKYMLEFLLLWGTEISYTPSLTCAAVSLQVDNHINWSGEIMRISLHSGSQAHLVSFAEMEQQTTCSALSEEKTNNDRKQSGFVTLFV